MQALWHKLQSMPQRPQRGRRGPLLARGCCLQWMTEEFNENGVPRRALFSIFFECVFKQSDTNPL
jgi:hypothetical protein